MKLPDKIFGISTEEAYKRYMEESEKKPVKGTKRPTPTITPSTIKNPKDYIILPATTHQPLDLLIAKTRSHDNESWNQCQKALPKEDHFMPPIRQFVDLLKLLQSDRVYDGSGTKLSHLERTNLFKDITEQRNPYGAEWLDAQFSDISNQRHITYHRFNSSGTLEQVTEPLDSDTLMNDKIPGISLEDWLKNPTPQGLPRRGIADGNLWYWFPRAGCVSRFRAGSDRVNLYCLEGPQYSNAGLGVRACAAGAPKNS